MGLFRFLHPKALQSWYTFYISFIQLWKETTNLNASEKGRAVAILVTGLVAVVLFSASVVQAQETTPITITPSDQAVLADLEALAATLSPELQAALLAKIQQLKGVIYVETKCVLSKTDALELDAELPALPGTGTAAAWANADINQRFLKARLEVEDGIAEVSGPTHPYSLHHRYQIPFNQDGFLSLVTECYQYTGGAHGMTFKTAYNLDLNRDRLLSLRDFFPERDNYVADIKTEIKAAIAADPDTYFPEAVETVDGWAGEFPFHLEEDNVVIFFHPYDLACYAAGFREFKIPYDRLP